MNERMQHLPQLWRRAEMQTHLRKMRVAIDDNVGLSMCYKFHHELICIDCFGAKLYYPVKHLSDFIAKMEELWAPIASQLCVVGLTLSVEKMCTYIHQAKATGSLIDMNYVLQPVLTPTSVEAKFATLKLIERCHYRIREIVLQIDLRLEDGISNHSIELNYQCIPNFIYALKMYQIFFL